MVITDNVGVLRDDYADDVVWVRDPADGIVSIRLPGKGGTKVSVRVE